MEMERSEVDRFAAAAAVTLDWVRSFRDCFDEDCDPSTKLVMSPVPIHDQLTALAGFVAEALAESIGDGLSEEQEE